ncbi:MFP1 attachment factor 1 [Linum grandiflorum]
MSDFDATAAVPSADPIASPPEEKAPPARRTNALNIWPPSERTRNAVISRLIETLSTPSVLSKRYGTLPPEEASEAARRIEEEAFAASVDFASADEDGLQILQHYSKEISKRMLETVKAHSETATATDNISPATPPLDVAPPAESAPAVVPASEEA